MAYIGENIRDKPSLIIEGGIDLITTDKDINNSIMIDTSYKDTVLKFVNIQTTINLNPHNNNIVIGELELTDGGELDVKYVAPSKAYTVTVQSVGGSNKYFIDGVQQKTLNLYKGGTYIFNHPSAHPFVFSTDSGNSSGYTTGVTVNSSTQVTLVVAANAPSNLYYYCSQHSGMGGLIKIFDAKAELKVL
tara:strand:- start:376 stop:945 length:570 start_codon:yes stop_codon:yes gene_type:complete